MTIDTIYDNLMVGKTYGHMVSNVKYPYFKEKLFSIIGGDNKRHFGWDQGGIGYDITPATKDNLEIIIRRVFLITPDEFIKRYECREKKVRVMK